MELGTAVRLPNGHTLVVERGVKPRLLEITKDGKPEAETSLKEMVREVPVVVLAPGVPLMVVLWDQLVQKVDLLSDFIVCDGYG